MAHPQSGYLSTVSGSNWNLEMLVFVEGGKAENPEKQGREPTTNSTQIWRQLRESNRVTLMGGECSHHCAIPAPLDVQKTNGVYVCGCGHSRKELCTKCKCFN